ncbi:MAG TPA: phage baseplate assembly protein [Bradyrhizobium sp.]|jgi:phage baseplate assembly protein V
MKHSTSRDSADRHGNSLSRASLEQADDSKLLQQVHIRLFHDEQMDEVEHLQPYGFTSVPKKPTGTGIMRQAADAILAFLGGNRSHPIAVMIADRRYRLNNLAEGEVAYHDDQGNQVYFQRDVLVINGVKEVHAQVGNAHVQLKTDKLKVQFNDLSVTIKDGKLFLGKEDVTHAVQTVDGPSQKVFASIGETDSAMSAAPTGKRTA